MLKSKITHESKVEPGAKFTVRALNYIQRARRDSGVSKQRLEYSRMLGQLGRMQKENLGEGDYESRKAKFDALPETVRQQMDTLSFESANILHEHLIPSALRAGLISIDGLVIEGASVKTVEELLESAPDELLDEIYQACEKAAGLTAEERKNS